MAYIDGLFEVAINDRKYRVVQELYSRRFLDVIRQQADASQEPSEATLNPNDLWRRSQDDWVLGSGQSIYDDDESVRKRYNTSTGVDPWTKGSLRLLKGMSRIDALTGVMAKSLIADGKLWVQQETTLAYWNGTTWANTGAAPYTIRDIATDGSNVYVVARDNSASNGGVYVLERGDTTFGAAMNNVIADKVAYVRGRLMVAASYSLYNITDVTNPAAPSPITAPAINSNWEWTAFGDGQSYIYVAGHGGDLSYVYRITLREDGSALTAPVVATQLPDGETVNVISSYLGVVLLGTSKGVRIAVPSGGSLQYGPLIETVGAVRTVEAQGRFAWFGGTTGRLLRVDLSRFLPQPHTLTPASALDLNTGQANDVVGLHTWSDGTRIALVDDTGVYQENASSLVSSGSFTSGRITFGLPDSKVGMFLEVACEAFSGTESVNVSVSYDGASPTSLGTLSGATNVDTFDLQQTADDFEVHLTLNPDGTTSPVVTRFTLKALPVPSRTEQVQVVLDLRETVLNLTGATTFQDVFSEFELLQALVRAGTPITYQEFDRSYTAILENVQWGPDLDVNTLGTSWEGNCAVTLKVYSA